MGHGRNVNGFNAADAKLNNSHIIEKSTAKNHRLF
jgi:hypothetical protein